MLAQLGGNSCSCHGQALAGMGDEPPRYRAIERALIEYMRAQLVAGEAFWISPDLNSDTVSLALLDQAGSLGDADLTSVDPYNLHSSSGGGGGGWISSIINTATSIGNAAVQILPSAATVAGAVKSLQTSLGHNGISVPQTVATAAVNSAQGFQITTPMLLLFGGALVFMIAMRA